MEDKKTIQQLKAESIRKDRMYQNKLDEFLKRLEDYRERSNTEVSFLQTNTKQKLIACNFGRKTC